MKKWRSALTEIIYFFMIVFLVLGIFMVVFIVGPADDFSNNSYNKRARETNEYISRGDIVTRDGVVIATTDNFSDGTSIRDYPYKNMFAHAVGFIGNGGMGIEKREGFSLNKSHEFVFSKILADLTGEKSKGDVVESTLLFDVQKAAYDAMEGRAGAVVAMEVRTGKIVCFVSKPDFDPGKVDEDWADMVNDDSSSVFVNRVTNGTYPPGSVFKIVTALEYMRENKDYEDYTYECSGGIDRGDGSVLHCYANEVHGKLDLTKAFAESCNTSFANIGMKLSKDKWKDTAEELLFNTALSDILDTSKSLYSLDENSTQSKTCDTAIGQGDTAVTPMHMCLIAAAVKNGGKVMKPIITDGVRSVDNTWSKEYRSDLYATIMTPEEAEKLMVLMDAAVAEGTARKLQSSLYSAGGKTGSAEYGTKKGASHGWFVGYAADKDEVEEREELAIAVIVEDGNTGAASAVPVAKAVFDAFYGRD